MELEMTKVESSNVHSIGYKDNDLFVRFKSGSLYRYKTIPIALFISMLKAESKGKFLNKEIKGKYDYEKEN